MGGGKSRPQEIHHYHTETRIETVQDPELVRSLDQSRSQIRVLNDLIVTLEKRLNQAVQEGRKQKNPKAYKELADKAFDMFVDNVQTLNFEQKIPRILGERHHVLIGNTSSGKSSLINYICGTKLAVGLGDVTQQLKKVACSADKKVHIWDSPGNNDEFRFYDVEVLAYFHSADTIFILYPDSVKCIKNMIQVLFAIKPSHTYLVRTQCDRWTPDQVKTIQQELETDKTLLRSWNINLPVLATSTKKGIDFLDNLKFKRLLIGEL